MPAPLAKGVIIAASVLIAAGVAVYENQQIWEWVDKSRRRIALALYGIGEEVTPTSGHDVAANNAVEAAKRKRDEIMRTNRERFMRKHLGEKGMDKGRSGSSSFDDFLEKDESSGAYTLRNTGVEVTREPGTMRRRTSQGTTSQRAVFKSDLLPAKQDDPTSPPSETIPEPAPASPPAVDKPKIRNIPIFDATETDPFSDQHSVEDSSLPLHQPSPVRPASNASFGEWTENSQTSQTVSPLSGTPSLHEQDTARSASPSTPSVHSISSAAPSSPFSEAADVTYTPSNISEVGLDELDSHDEGVDSASDSGIMTPRSWTEVGSEVSEGDLSARL